MPLQLGDRAAPRSRVGPRVGGARDHRPRRMSEAHQPGIAGQGLGECEGQEGHDEDGGHHAPSFPATIFTWSPSASCPRYLWCSSPQLGFPCDGSQRHPAPRLKFARRRRTGPPMASARRGRTVGTSVVNHPPGTRARLEPNSAAGTAGEEFSRRGPASRPGAGRPRPGGASRAVDRDESSPRRGPGGGPDRSHARRERGGGRCPVAGPFATPHRAGPVAPGAGDGLDGGVVDAHGAPHTGQTRRRPRGAARPSARRARSPSGPVRGPRGGRSMWGVPKQDFGLGHGAGEAVEFYLLTHHAPPRPPPTSCR